MCLQGGHPSRSPSKNHLHPILYKTITPATQSVCFIPVPQARMPMKLEKKLRPRQLGFKVSLWSRIPKRKHLLDFLLRCVDISSFAVLAGAAFFQSLSSLTQWPELFSTNLCYPMLRS